MDTEPKVIKKYLQRNPKGNEKDNLRAHEKDNLSRPNRFITKW